jgi:hypothetical protein
MCCFKLITVLKWRKGIRAGGWPDLINEELKGRKNGRSRAVFDKIETVVAKLQLYPFVETHVPS